jgi:hypothetical protein
MTLNEKNHAGHALVFGLGGIGGIGCLVAGSWQAAVICFTLAAGAVGLAYVDKKIKEWYER